MKHESSCRAPELRALPHLQPTATCLVAVAAAWATAAPFVDNQADSAERTKALDYLGNGRLSVAVDHSFAINSTGPDHLLGRIV